MIFYNADKQVFHLQGPRYSYYMGVQDGVLEHLYWGARLVDEDVSPIAAVIGPYSNMDKPFNRRRAELPTQEKGYFGMHGLDIINHAGDDVLELRYCGHRIFAGKQPLPELPASYVECEDEADTLEIDLKDELIGVCVTLSYTVFHHYDVLARSMRVSNASEETMTIRGLQAASVRLPNERYEVMNLKGNWARERHVMRDTLPQGCYSVTSRRGASGNENSPFLALMSPSTTETQGDVYAMTWVYSGSFTVSADVNVDFEPLLSIGFASDTFSWKLEAGESFQSPEALLVYSNAGLNGMSAAYHPFIRDRICRGSWRDRERPILVNNWEATYFSFDEEKILSIAERGAEMGCELFVLDDGWFGKRDADNCSLGDWVVYEEKLPSGLNSLATKINEMGMAFGIWFEPEMVSPDSDLYRAHPDWCQHVPGRDRTEARQQLVLDFARKDVQDYIIDALTKILKSAPISYVKWDMNRNMIEGYCQTLPVDRRMESQHRYMLGLYRVMDELVSAFPDVLFEGCSSGGGRFDCGILYYMPQYWTSDDTDAYERIKIQYGTSMVYPCSTMGAHVSAVPNHQTGRYTPFQTRCDVALGGNFGFELDLSKMSDEDVETAKAAIQKVKRLRPMLQTGSFARLVSPFDNGNLAAWQYIAKDEQKALLCMYQVLVVPNGPSLRVRMTGLVPDALYRRVDTGDVLSGAALMNIGVPVPIPENDFASWVVEFERV